MSLLAICKLTAAIFKLVCHSCWTNVCRRCLPVSSTLHIDRFGLSHINEHRLRQSAGCFETNRFTHTHTWASSTMFSVNHSFQLRNFWAEQCLWMFRVAHLRLNSLPIESSEANYLLDRSICAAQKLTSHTYIGAHKHIHIYKSHFSICERKQISVSFND